MTVDEAREYLAELGLALPLGLLTCLVGTLSKPDACMIGAGYDECTQNLIRYYLLGLLAIGNGARRIKSQTAPSGASRSFEYGTVQDQRAGLLANLRALDTSGCTAGMIPDTGMPLALYTGRGCR